MIRGICIILLFYFLGEVASYFMNGFIPGSVCGMVLLFAALMSRILCPEHVRQVSKILTQNMALFFSPAGVGIMANFGIIAENWVALAVIAVGTTILVLLSVGISMQILDKRIK